MKFSVQDRHLYGAGAAATVATVIFAGVVFGLVVAIGALVAVWAQRRRSQRESCASDPPGPIDLEFSTRPSSDTT